jgi:aryl carrier-like protein
MAARLSEAQRGRWARLGVGSLDPGAALEALERALVGAAPHVAVLAADPARLAAEAGPAVRALLGAPAAAARPAPAAEATDALAALRAATSAGPGERLALLRPYVHEQAARVLGFSSTALDVATPLSALGLDSLMAVQLKNRLLADLAVELPMAELLAGPTVAELSEGLAARLGGSAPAGGPAAESWEQGSL